MSLYSLLCSFLPLVGVIVGVWFIISIFDIPAQFGTGEVDVTGIILPIFILAIFVSILLITNLYGI